MARTLRALRQEGRHERYHGLLDGRRQGWPGFYYRRQVRFREWRVPTVAGLLLLGTEAALRAHIPTHEVAFQVLDGTQVRVNDFYRTPLLKTFDRIDEQFKARVTSEELQLGLFRVPVPNYGSRAFREAFVNALIHRDYTRLGAVQVRWEAEAIVISNPGGFVEGVTLENLLVVELRPRNPLLADAVNESASPNGRAAAST